MLYLSQDPSKYSALTGSNISKIGAIAACNSDIDSDPTDLARTRAEMCGK